MDRRGYRRDYPSDQYAQGRPDERFIPRLQDSEPRGQQHQMSHRGQKVESGRSYDRHSGIDTRAHHVTEQLQLDPRTQQTSYNEQGQQHSGLLAPPDLSHQDRISMGDWRQQHGFNDRGRGSLGRSVEPLMNRMMDPDQERVQPDRYEGAGRMADLPPVNRQPLRQTEPQRDFVDYRGDTSNSYNYGENRPDNRHLEDMGTLQQSRRSDQRSQERLDFAISPRSQQTVRTESLGMPNERQGLNQPGLHQSPSSQISLDALKSQLGGQLGNLLSKGLLQLPNTGGFQGQVGREGSQYSSSMQFPVQASPRSSEGGSDDRAPRSILKKAARLNDDDHDYRNIQGTKAPMKDLPDVEQVVDEDDFLYGDGEKTDRSKQSSSNAGKIQYPDKPKSAQEFVSDPSFSALLKTIGLDDSIAERLKAKQMGQAGGAPESAKKPQSRDRVQATDSRPPSFGIDQSASFLSSDALGDLLQLKKSGPENRNYPFERDQRPAVKQPRAVKDESERAAEEFLQELERRSRESESRRHHSESDHRWESDRSHSGERRSKGDRGYRDSDDSYRKSDERKDSRKVEGRKDEDRRDDFRARYGSDKYDEREDRESTKRDAEVRKDMDRSSNRKDDRSHRSDERDHRDGDYRRETNERRSIDQKAQENRMDSEKRHIEEDKILERRLADQKELEKIIEERKKLEAMLAKSMGYTDSRAETEHSRTSFTRAKGSSGAAKNQDNHSRGVPDRERMSDSRRQTLDSSEPRIYRKPLSPATSTTSKQSSKRSRSRSPRYQRSEDSYSPGRRAESSDRSSGRVKAKQSDEHSSRQLFPIAGKSEVPSRRVIQTAENLDDGDDSSLQNLKLVIHNDAAPVAQVQEEPPKDRRIVKRFGTLGDACLEKKAVNMDDGPDSAEDLDDVPLLTPHQISSIRTMIAVNTDKLKDFQRVLRNLEEEQDMVLQARKHATASELRQLDKTMSTNNTLLSELKENIKNIKKMITDDELNLNDHYLKVKKEAEKRRKKREEEGVRKGSGRLNSQFEKQDRQYRKFSSNEGVDGRSSKIPDDIEYFDPGSHWCRSCSFVAYKLTGYLEHLQTSSHLKRMDKIGKPWQPDEVRNPPRKKADRDRSDKKIEPMKGMEFFVPVECFYCLVCNQFSGDIPSAEHHLKTEGHQIAYQAYITDNPMYERRWKLDKEAGVLEAKKLEKKRKDAEERRREQEKEEKEAKERERKRKIEEKKQEEEDRKRRKKMEEVYAITRGNDSEPEIVEQPVDKLLKKIETAKRVETAKERIKRELLEKTRGKKDDKGSKSQKVDSKERVKAKAAEIEKSVYGPAAPPPKPGSSADNDSKTNPEDIKRVVYIGRIPSRNRTKSEDNKGDGKETRALADMSEDGLSELAKVNIEAVTSTSSTTNAPTSQTNATITTTATTTPTENTPVITNKLSSYQEEENKKTQATTASQPPLPPDNPPVNVTATSSVSYNVSLPPSSVQMMFSQGQSIFTNSNQNLMPLSSNQYPPSSQWNMGTPGLNPNASQLKQMSSFVNQSQMGSMSNEMSPIPNQMDSMQNNMGLMMNQNQMHPMPGQMGPMPNQMGPMPNRMGPLPDRMRPMQNQMGSGMNMGSRARQMCMPNRMPPGFMQMRPGANQMGPRPNQMGPGPNQMGPGPNQMGPGPNQMGPGPNQMRPGFNQMGPGPMFGPGFIQMGPRQNLVRMNQMNSGPMVRPGMNFVGPRQANRPPVKQQTNFKPGTSVVKDEKISSVNVSVADIQNVDMEQSDNDDAEKDQEAEMEQTESEESDGDSGAESSVRATSFSLSSFLSQMSNSDVKSKDKPKTSINSTNIQESSKHEVAESNIAEQSSTAETMESQEPISTSQQNFANSESAEQLDTSQGQLGESQFVTDQLQLEQLQHTEHGTEQLQPGEQQQQPEEQWAEQQLQSTEQQTTEQLQLCAQWQEQQFGEQQLPGQQPPDDQQAENQVQQMQSLEEPQLTQSLEEPQLTQELQVTHQWQEQEVQQMDEVQLAEQQENQIAEQQELQEPELQPAGMIRRWAEQQMEQQQPSEQPTLDQPVLEQLQVVDQCEEQQQALYLELSALEASDQQDVQVGSVIAESSEPIQQTIIDEQVNNEMSNQAD